VYYETGHTVDLRQGVAGLKTATKMDVRIVTSRLFQYSDDANAAEPEFHHTMPKETKAIGLGREWYN
jgi:hypothetical protein